MKILVVARQQYKAKATVEILTSKPVIHCEKTIWKTVSECEYLAQEGGDRLINLSHYRKFYNNWYWKYIDHKLWLIII